MRIRNPLGFSLLIVGALALGFGLESRAQESSSFIDPQFREELLVDLDGLDDELATLRAVTEEYLSQPAKFARACLLYALEWIREEKDLASETLVADRVKKAAEVALFLLKGYQVASSVFATKCLEIQDPEFGTASAAKRFVGINQRESPHFDIKAIEDIKVDIEVLFQNDIVTRVGEAIHTGLIKGEDLIVEIQTELNAMFLKLFELNAKLIEADVFINQCVNQLLGAIAAVEKELKGISDKAEPNLRKAASAIKRCVRDLNRLVRIEKGIFLEVKELILEKVLFIKKLFFLVPLPIPGPTPPPIGLRLNSGAVSVQVFDLKGRLVFDSAASGSLRWNHVAANGVYFYVVTARAADGRLLRGNVQKLVVLR